MSEYFVPGSGLLVETGTRQYFISGYGLLHDILAAGGDTVLVVAGATHALTSDNIALF